MLFILSKVPPFFSTIILAFFEKLNPINFSLLLNSPLAKILIWLLVFFNKPTFNKVSMSKGFDVEIIFMYPWAVTFREIGLFGLVAMLIFSFAVFESFLYIIGNGALEWGPVKQIVRKSIVDPNRTTNTTIRRVGLEGRTEAEEEAA